MRPVLDVREYELPAGADMAALCRRAEEVSWEGQPRRP
ncbi:hypothetical protein CcI6DRAFT_01202 [Frankia sp. CcI6]|nr:hypothetical protein CcI6DRAFT_01202 [Frankia sp. CcI6]OAA25785.1 hypothetical protein AAY23_10365 [Frankia casuarinae]